MPDLTVLGDRWEAALVRVAAASTGWRIVEADPGTGALAVGGDPAAAAVAAGAFAAGRPTLVLPPLGPGSDDADALVEAARAHRTLTGYAEGLALSPLVDTAIEHRRGVGPPRRLHIELAGRPDGSSAADPLDELGPAAAALLLRLAPPLVPQGIRTTEDASGVRLDVDLDGGPAAVLQLAAGASTPSWSAEVVSDVGVVRLELLPNPSVESQRLDVTPEAPAGADPVLVGLGTDALLRGFAGAMTGRGGAVCPLGFGRQAAALLRAAGNARCSGERVDLRTGGGPGGDAGS